MQLPYKILGAPGSPYSRKLRAAIRYRRLPYIWANRNGSEDVNTPQLAVNLLPVMVVPGEKGDYKQAKIDSTPILRYLEDVHKQRSLLPSNPIMGFLDYLIEDYGDEWLTKAMFHYRWSHQENVDFAGSIIPLWLKTDAAFAEIESMAEYISTRQIERLRYVGSNEKTGQFIEDSYVRFLNLLDRHLTGRRFILGNRPGCGDFGVFGQLTQLAQTDPTSRAVTLKNAPRIFAWCDNVEDLSGLEPKKEDWMEFDAIPETLMSVLEEIGKTYVPYLIANNRALEAGQEQWEAEINGSVWSQASFPYQAKCLAWIREEFSKLTNEDQETLADLLEKTDCRPLIG
jgi:glutathione S-transferase